MLTRANLLLLPAIIAPIAACAQSPVVHRSDWPAIKPFNFKIKIDTHSEKIFFSIPIYDKAGKAIYTFACHGGREKHLDSLEKTLGECIVSPMCFFLGEGSKNTTGPLLGEDGVASWHTRGQVRFEELIGACGNYPEFGKVRHFRVRGMTITTAFTNIEVDHQGSPRFLDLEISGIYDPSVTSSFTERPGYLHPRGDCNSIKKGKEPLMFRNDSGSWVEEKELQRPRQRLTHRSTRTLPLRGNVRSFHAATAAPVNSIR